MRKCSVHNVELKCIGGCSAHPNNWYCPECDKETHATSAIKERSIDSLCDEFRSIVQLAAKMLERDETPARTEVAKDLRSSAGVVIEKLRTI